MKNLLQDYNFIIGEGEETAFNLKNDVRQDGTTPMCRDGNGKLWAISGHSHAGRIAMFSGTCASDMAFAYYIETNFAIGHADYAFNGIKYPEGIKARGSVWPFGLYICPKTNRFFAFFHNETGWAGRGTAYDSWGLCNTPKIDSDFRHVGLMHSDDNGKTWNFDRWVLTAESVCFTQNYNPDNVNVIGQDPNKDVSLGSGDFSIYIEPFGDYIYIFYNIATINLVEKCWKECDVCVARTRKREDGIMGDFVKYYNGSFCESGNFGKETPIVKRAWHAKVNYFKQLDAFVMSSCRMQPAYEENISTIIEDVMQIRTSKDLVNWSEPFVIEKDGKEFGNHYVAIFSDSETSSPSFIEDNEFSIMTNHNGTNVTRYKTKIEKK